ncbi:MAG: hypothetical protein P4M11_11740 [Candidatus Pacebacteria bacterium]|nr:hypothetical protein [Candidatus Paceibacterota bacterium]
MPGYLRGVHELLARKPKVRTEITPARRVINHSLLESSKAEYENNNITAPQHREKLTTPLLRQCVYKNSRIMKSRLLAGILPSRPHFKAAIVIPSSISTLTCHVPVVDELKAAGFQELGPESGKNVSRVQRKVMEYYDCVSGEMKRRVLPDIVLENYSPYHAKSVILLTSQNRYHCIARVPRSFDKRLGQFTRLIESRKKMEDLDLSRESDAPGTSRTCKPGAVSAISASPSLCPRYSRSLLRQRPKRTNVSVMGNSTLDEYERSMVDSDSENSSLRSLFIRKMRRLPALQLGRVALLGNLKKLTQGEEDMCGRQINVQELIGGRRFRYLWDYGEQVDRERRESAEPAELLIKDEVKEYEKRRAMSRPHCPFYHYKFGPG